MFVPMKAKNINLAYNPSFFKSCYCFFEVLRPIWEQGTKNSVGIRYFCQGQQIHYKEYRSDPTFRCVLSFGLDIAESICVFPLPKFALYQVSLVPLFFELAFLIGSKFLLWGSSQGFPHDPDIPFLEPFPIFPVQVDAVRQEQLGPMAKGFPYRSLPVVPGPWIR